MFIKGFIIGFSIAAPVGPIGLLCIKRTLTAGRMSGFVSGLGAAVSAVFYGLVAALGLTSVSNFLITHKAAFQFLGGIFLCLLGLQIYFSKAFEIKNHVSQHNHFKDFISTFFLSITNPLTILSFIAVFAGFGVVSSSYDYMTGLLLVAGIFLGETLWWFILSFTTGFFRKSLNPSSIIVINRISGSIIIAFGCWAFSEFLKHILSH